MGDAYPDADVSAHLDALRRMQNADGGWGYFPNKQSWLEPTAYAALALRNEPAADRAWSLIRSWQMPDGGWRPAGDVQIANWATALCVTIATVRGEFGEPFQKGVAWLLESAGNEARFTRRTLVAVGERIGMVEHDRDLNLKGWPWTPGASSWVEPTAHSLVALRQAEPHIESKERSKLRERLRLGEAELIDVRCQDGGWNYGSRAARGQGLSSYPETTAMALIGLQGHTNLSKSLDRASQMMNDPLQGAAKSPLSRAWLRIALRLHGVRVDLPLGSPLRDVVVTAVDAIGAGANYQVFRAGGIA